MFSALQMEAVVKALAKKEKKDQKHKKGKRQVSFNVANSSGEDKSSSESDSDYSDYNSEIETNRNALALSRG